MKGKADTPPEMARARIEAIYKVTSQLAQRTGGDHAEAAYELICAAILVLQEARPKVPPAELISRVAPDCAITVDDWFPDELKKFRRGQA